MGRRTGWGGPNRRTEKGTMQAISCLALYTSEELLSLFLAFFPSTAFSISSRSTCTGSQEHISFSHIAISLHPENGKTRRYPKQTVADSRCLPRIPLWASDVWSPCCSVPKNSECLVITRGHSAMETVANMAKARRHRARHLKSTYREYFTDYTSS